MQENGFQMVLELPYIYIPINRNGYKYFCVPQDRAWRLLYLSQHTFFRTYLARPSCLDSKWFLCHQKNPLRKTKDTTLNSEYLIHSLSLAAFSFHFTLPLWAKEFSKGKSSGFYTVFVYSLVYLQY